MRGLGVGTGRGNLVLDGRGMVQSLDRANDAGQLQARIGDAGIVEALQLGQRSLEARLQALFECQTCLLQRAQGVEVLRLRLVEWVEVIGGSCQPKRFASLIGSDSVAVWPSPTTRFDGSTARLK